MVILGFTKLYRIWHLYKKKIRKEESWINKNAIFGFRKATKLRLMMMRRRRRRRR